MGLWGRLGGVATLDLGLVSVTAVSSIAMMVAAAVAGGEKMGRIKLGRSWDKGSEECGQVGAEPDGELGCYF